MNHTCKICGENIDVCWQHLRIHKLTKKEYYDIFFKKKNEGVCVICGKPTNFISLKNRYAFVCSTACSGKRSSIINGLKHLKTTRKKQYDKEHPKEGLCIICNKKTKFVSSTFGYRKTCSPKCRTIQSKQKTLCNFHPHIKNISMIESICPICKQNFGVINKKNLLCMAHHLEKYEFTDCSRKDAVNIIYDKIFSKQYCKICKNEVDFLGIARGYKKYCNACVKNREFSKVKNLDLNKLQERGKKITKSKLAFYKTKKGKLVAKSIGEKNKINTTLFNNTKHGKQIRKASGKKISEALKRRILTTEYSPKSTNRRTHWQYIYNGKKFRSSWEKDYYMQLIKKYGESNIFYEKHRIPYISEKDNKEHIYIVDFSVKLPNMWILIEVKPKEMIHLIKDKILYTNNYCSMNGYEFKIVTGEDIYEINKN